MPVPFARSASQTRPTFSRDFAGLKTLDHGAGPAITFTRASNATYFDASGVLQTASNNEPRFDHDPATGASRGLLIEESRTNLLERSEELDNAYWTKSNTTIASNNATALDGQQTADRVVETAFNGSHPVYRGVTVTSSVPYTVTAFVKAQERTRVRVGITQSPTDYYVDCNLSTGAIIQTTAGETSAVTNVGNGWYRISLTRTVSTTSVNAFVAILNDSGQFSYAGDVTKGLLIWGLQLEQGAFPTSYIPTTTAAATRSADSAVVTPISSFYNQSEGTLFAEYSPASLPPSGNFPRALSLGNTTNNDNRNVLVYFNSSGSLAHLASYFVSNVQQLDKSTTLGSVGQTFKAASAVATNSGHYALNGLLVGAEDTSITMGADSDFTHLFIARQSSGPVATTAIHIRKIAYYPRRLSNTLLQQLTT